MSIYYRSFRNELGPDHSIKTRLDFTHEDAVSQPSPTNIRNVCEEQVDRCLSEGRGYSTPPKTDVTTVTSCRSTTTNTTLYTANCAESSFAQMQNDSALYALSLL